MVGVAYHPCRLLLLFFFFAPGLPLTVGRPTSSSKNINNIAHISKMMEKLHRFMTFINEKYREDGDIQIDCEQMKNTISEILQTKTREDLSENWPKIMQPLVDDRFNGPITTKLVKPISVTSSLDEDLDCPVVVENVAMNDAYEDTISDRQIDEGNDMARCNKIYAERVVNDEEVAHDLEKDPGKSLVEMVLHNCNRKQTGSLKPREWLDGEVINYLSTLLTYIERWKHNGKAKIWYFSTWFQRLGLHKAPQHGFKDKYKLDVSNFSIDDANWCLQQGNT
ncbi:hypothetical protein M9H77_21269 [Catharanthus roseus]|uniref:Uncharacterized protein n=1 Tax=Catharanthus roseus TaxID=4058 RepID=A0ACC0AMK3_CATRO|nr:hypothetical protein M9H77_21269 [Catharanthus roseus]